MIECGRQEEMVQYLKDKLQWIPSPAARTIGSVDKDGRILGVVGYDNWNCASCTMDIAGEPGWLSKQLIWAAFDYPFNVLGCNVVLSSIASTNKRSLSINERLGFKTECVIPSAHPKGDLVIRSLRKEDCVWLKKFEGIYHG